MPAEITKLAGRRKRSGPGRPCTVCEHPERDAIDDALLRGLRYRTIADRFGVASHASVITHAQKHMDALATTQPEDDIFTPEGLRKAIRALAERMRGLLDVLEVSDPTKADKAGRELRMCLQLAAQITGELQATEDHMDEGLALIVESAMRGLAAALLEKIAAGADVAVVRREAPALIAGVLEATARDAS